MSLSIPRVVLQSTGCTSSFNGVRAVVEGNTLVGADEYEYEYGELLGVWKALKYRSLALMANRRDYHSLLPPHRYLLLYLRTQSLRWSCHPAPTDPHLQLQ
jgi:hypothetical protein